MNVPIDLDSDENQLYFRWEKIDNSEDFSIFEEISLINIESYIRENKYRGLVKYLQDLAPHIWWRITCHGCDEMFSGNSQWQVICVPEEQLWEAQNIFDRFREINDIDVMDIDIKVPTEKLIDNIYLPFTAESLKENFLKDDEGQIKYYQKSAERYHDHIKQNTTLKGNPISKSKIPRQIEKDERFWTASATKSVIDHPCKINILKQLLIRVFGEYPPISGSSFWGPSPEMATWDYCLQGEINLYFEACIPAPKSYVNWLRSNLDDRQIIPYILDAAKRDNKRTLEGATHVDAVFYNRDNGFTWFIEAKVLSDTSYQTSFDNQRNQIIRNIDIMLDEDGNIPSLAYRSPDLSLFTILTPRVFKDNPSSRLYGWLMKEYMDNPNALKRDLPHREGVDWASVAERIGWVTFEDFNEVLPVACPWIK